MSKAFASVCTGVGLFELAATWLGYKCVFTSEIKPYCQQLLAKRYPQTTHYGDFTTKSFRAHARINYRWRIDVLAAGLPCQPFSVAGLKKGQMDERHLGPAFVGLVAAIRPAWVIVENVAGFVKMALDDFTSAMEAKGYACEAFVLPACAVGAPHRRDRVWIICHSPADAHRIDWGRQRSHARRRGPGARHQFGRRLADLANANCFGLKVAGLKQPVSKSKRNDTNPADASGKGLQGAKQSGTYIERTGASRSVTERAGFSGWDEHWHEVATRICRVDDGNAARVDGPGRGGGFVEYRPSRRYRTARLEVSGNGLVSHIPYEILRFIDSL